MSAREGEVIDGQATPVGEQRSVTEYRPPANPLDADPQQFAVSIQQRGQNYATLINWLVENMVVGEDLVQVHFVKKDKCDRHGPRPYGDCTPTTHPHHWSDPDLSKSGAEKVCGLLGLGARFLGMEDFRRMALKGVKIQDVICTCEIFGTSREAMSEGTGACNVDEVGGNLNRAMKTAEKRAHIDAVKRLGGLSGIATAIKKRMQPLDLDRAQRGQRQPNAPRPAAGDEKPRQMYNTGAVLTHCPISKNYKGKPWRECPSDFLEWIVRECADKPDLVKAAAGELAKRKQGSDSTHTRPPPPSQGSPPYPVDPDFNDDIPF